MAGQLKARKINQISEATRISVQRNKCFSTLPNAKFKKCGDFLPSR